MPPLKEAIIVPSGEKEGEKKSLLSVIGDCLPDGRFMSQIVPFGMRAGEAWVEFARKRRASPEGDQRMGK